MRSTLKQLLPLLQIVSAVFMIWRGLCIVANTSHPIHVVISESMEPAFQRGDIIVVSNCTDKVEVGDIAVLWFPHLPLPMVHRVIKNGWVPHSSKTADKLE
jgi:signal peptidase I